MNLLKLFQKKLKIASHGFTLVELTVVVALTGIITTFLLSMLVATNTHMNNDLISVATTAELRNAQIFFENWVRYNDKAGVTFTGTYAPVAAEAVEIVSASSGSSLKFNVSIKQLSIQGDAIPEWPTDDSGNPETSIKFNLINNITIEVSSDNKMVKCICTVGESEKTRDFTYVYARRAS